MNRILANSGATLGIAVLVISLAIAGAGLAQTKSTKKAAPGGKDAAAVARGKELFQQKCSTCHYDTSDAKKIGPGLKGISKRGTFTVNNNKVTDETLKTWIENGDCSTIVRNRASDARIAVTSRFVSSTATGLPSSFRCSAHRLAATTRVPSRRV